MGVQGRTTTGLALLALLGASAPVGARAQSNETNGPLIPPEGATGAWIGAVSGGVIGGSLLALLVSGTCETESCQVGLAAVAGALAGGSAGAFLGQVAGTAIGTGLRMRPAGWVQGGVVWGTDRSDGGALGGGGRVAVLARMNDRLSAGVELSRFQSPLRTGQVPCGRGCDPSSSAPRDVRITGSITSVALVERLDVPVGRRGGAHALLGLGFARMDSRWTFPDGRPSAPHVVPTNPSETNLHVTAGAGAGVRLTSSLSATGELRWEPAFGSNTFSVSLGLAYR